MRGRLFFFVGLIVVGLAVAGCVVTPTSLDTDAATVAASPRRHLTRTVTIRTAPATTAPVSVPRVRTSRTAEPSPWMHLDAAPSGPTALVVRARGEVPVSAVQGGPVLSLLSNRTRVGAPRVLLVVADAGEWLQVLLPLRPNGSVGWVRRADVDLVTVSLRLEIDRAAHRLRVFDNDALVMDEPVAVGRAATPTPTGQFFVTELLRPPNQRGAYGPYAFTLSGFSTVYQRFGSGDGAVGLHGTNEPRSIGADVTHGCVRAPNDVIVRLATMLPLGTPVFIR